jgi:hypothetical protein
MLGVLLLVGIRSAAAQTQPEEIRGRVTDPNGRPIAGASVVVTRAPDRLNLSTRTDSLGAYQVTFVQGTGDYLLHISAPGWQSFRQRVQRSGAQPLVVDVKLAVDPVRLAPVVAQTRRQRPQRGSAFGPETGAAESIPDGVVGAVAPDQAGDPLQLAATIPGVIVTSEGLSALGLTGQSSTTLNGMSFAGAEVPRDLRTRTRVSYSTYDPARGGFGSAQVAIELSPGSAFNLRRSHVSFDARPLQISDAAGSGLGSEYDRLQLSLGADGELVENKWYYNLGLQASRRVSDAPSLLAATPSLLRTGGVAPDSVARLANVLSTLGVPSYGGAPRTTRAYQTLSFLGRLDHTPGPENRRSWGLVWFANASRADPQFPLLTATPAHGTLSSLATGGIQAVYSAYVGEGTLTEARSAFTLSSRRNTRYVPLPEGIVQVSASSTDVASGTAPLYFGGNAGAGGDDRAWTWETTSETQWFPANSPHRLKLYGQLRYDGYHRRPDANSLGTFVFESIADLAANRPSSYLRTLNPAASEGGEWNGVLALGDLWRRSRRLQFLYGVRLEGNRFTARPERNPEVEAAFGRRTDLAPDRVHLSPRAGFTWTYGVSAGAGFRSSLIGQRNLASRGVIRGGVGEFRNLLAPTLLSRALAESGGPDGPSTLFCAGAAVPVPDWEGFLAGTATVPDECVGAVTTPLAERAPVIDLLSDSYTAARSWRGNLAWSSSLGRLGFSIEGIYSLNLNQPDWIDLNFSDAPRFGLPAERDRPVFVTPGGITSSGVVSPAEARVYNAYGRVAEERSDLRSVSRQLTITLTPDFDFGKYFLSTAYTLGSVDSRARGFAGTTFASPARLRDVPGALDIRHQFLIQAGWAVPQKLSFTFLTRIYSGLPYSPRVASDINGDGLANDLAFVFDPAAVADPELRNGLRDLFTSGSSSARRCLERYVGRPAAMNGCRSPWTAAMNARLQFTNQFLRTGRRMNVGVNLANPLALADRVVNGSRLRGWGSPAIPDPTLYYVRGFDAASRAYRYAVNLQFGRPFAGTAAFREPFRITLDVSIDWGRPLPMQQLRLLLRPGRGGRPGNRVSPEVLQQRYRQTVPDVYAAVLSQSDSLLLLPEQVTALSSAQRSYRTQVDSVWRDLAQYLAALPDEYDQAEALRRQEAATRSVWMINAAQGPVLRSTLFREQIRLLTGVVRSIIEGRLKDLPRTYFSR